MNHDETLTELMNLARGATDILEGRVKGATVTNALLNLDMMRSLLQTLPRSDSPRETVNDSYSGDLEYHVEDHKGVHIFENIGDAGRVAFMRALSYGEADVDVVVWSEEGAAAFGGDDAVEEYLEDPEASVFARIQVRLDHQGKVP